MKKESEIRNCESFIFFIQARINRTEQKAVLTESDRRSINEDKQMISSMEGHLRYLKGEMQQAA